MSDNIILNSSNITNAGNNKLKYNFPRDVKFGKNDSLAISHLNIYYSWFNISKKYNNDFFQYSWWGTDGTISVTMDVTIPSGYYTINTLYEYFQSVMVKNGHYLETTTGEINYVYFIELVTNASHYGIEFRVSSFGEWMDFGDANGLSPYTDLWTSPNPAIWALPACSKEAPIFLTPQIIIPSNSNFGKLIGFSPQTISKDTTGLVVNERYSFLNDVVPNMNPSSSFIVTSNLISNGLSNPDNVLHSFTIPNNVGFGDLITLNGDVIYAWYIVVLYSSSRGPLHS
jgi:hypothetical protein